MLLGPLREMGAGGARHGLDSTHANVRRQQQAAALRLLGGRTAPRAASSPAPPRRYNGGNKGRIWNGSGSNYLSGHWNGAAGVAYHNAWVDGNAGDRYGTSWVLSVDQVNLYRAQVGSNSGTSGSLGTSITWVVAEAGAY
jgi:hypothetical protein